MTKKDIIYIGAFDLIKNNASAQRVIANGEILKKLKFNISYITISKKSLPIFM